jgi:hypothetical protein
MAAKNLGAFKADLKAFSEQMGIGIGQVRRKVTLDMFARIVPRTPADTGRARAGWNVSDISPDPSVPPEGQESYPPPVAGPLSAEPFQVAYLTNALPYIEPLEFEGHSKQAPNGFARITLAEAEAEMESLIRK